MSEYIGDIVTGSSSDLLADSWSKSFLNRNDTRRCLLLLFLVCTLFNLGALKAHQVLTAGKYTAEFDYDVVGTLAAARYDETEVLYKLPDRIGNIYPDRFGKEATYERGGRRKEDKEWTYHFDGEGFLMQRVSKTESIERYDWIRRKLLTEPLTWTYEWDGAGQLVRVKNNKKVNLRFEYDALGRRVAKINEYGKAENHKITRFLWDGNVPLHEWSYPFSERPETIDDSDGRRSYASPEPQTELTTWIFDEGTFVPSAKLVGERRYSIISDYLGTPIEAYDEEGKRVWARELDIYGRTRSEVGEAGFIPFLYQGQYLDTETGLAYNRYRYYDPSTGNYISQDPIRLEAGLTNLYAYVHDVNAWVDPWGLVPLGTEGFSVYALYEKGCSTPYYIGITRQDVDVRMEQHIKSGRYGATTTHRVLHSDLTIERARGYEQFYIEKYQTKTGIIGQEVSSTIKGNKINSFDKNRVDPRGKAFKAEYDDIVANHNKNIDPNNFH